MFGKRERPNYAHIEQLERENGLDDGTFSDEWVEDIQAKLDEAGIGAPPKKRELFKPPILEKKIVPLLTQHAVASSAYSMAPGAVWHVDDPLTPANYTQVMAHKMSVSQQLLYGVRVVE